MIERASLYGGVSYIYPNKSSGKPLKITHEHQSSPSKENKEILPHIYVGGKSLLARTTSVSPAIVKALPGRGYLM